MNLSYKIPLKNIYLLSFFLLVFSSSLEYLSLDLGIFYLQPAMLFCSLLIFVFFNAKLPKNLVLIFFIFIIFLSINTILSINSLTSMSRLFQYLILFICFFISYIITRVNPKLYEKSLMFSGFFVNIFTLIEYLSFKHNLNVPFLANKQFRVVFLEGGDFAFRATGTFIDSAVLGGFLCIIFFYFFNKVLFDKQSKIYFLLVMLLLVVSLFNIFQTYSRSVWLGFTITFSLNTLFLFIKLNFKKKIQIIITLILLLSIVTLYLFKTGSFQNFLLRLFESGSESNEGHFFALITALEMLIDKPLFGQGMGTFSDYVGFYMMSHSMYLTFLSEQGIVGFLLNLLFFFLPIFILLKKRLLSKSYYFVSICFSLISFYFNNIGYDYYNQFYFWILLGFSYGLIDRNHQSRIFSN